ncbi:MAG: tRNA 2-thiouridine(34) synthase MnmA [Treponema sp.]|nr:tRNA 2-thiouridine(34) synthase MnmA [Treponema sp.]
MSGGVDSSVAAALMLRQGYECIGVTLKLFSGGSRCCSLEDVNDARAAAERLGMPHYVFNFTGLFKTEVIDRFVKTYQEGATPNPCIDCNRSVKFNALLLRTRQIDFDYLVTGHYAQIEKDEASGRYLLKKSADQKKDQSYVLYCLTQEQLARTCFPLGPFTKSRVREIAAGLELGNARKQESQDICFVPDRDYAAFIERYTGRNAAEGDILDLDGNIRGRHRGLIRYTIGQRRGVGAVCSRPLYVKAKSVTGNTLTVGPEESLYSKTLFVVDLNLIACASLEKPLRVKVKTRYLQHEQWAVAEQTGPDTLRVDFDEAQRAITPGQAAVLYDGDIVVGGGTITAPV